MPIRIPVIRRVPDVASARMILIPVPMIMMVKEDTDLVAMVRGELRGLALVAVPVMWMVRGVVNDRINRFGLQNC